MSKLREYCDPCEGRGDGSAHGVEGECSNCNGYGHIDHEELVIVDHAMVEVTHTAGAQVVALVVADHVTEEPLRTGEPVTVFIVRGDHGDSSSFVPIKYTLLKRPQSVRLARTTVCSPEDEAAAELATANEGHHAPRREDT